MATGIGLRIKKRREELNLTQTELAALMGYKGKSAVCKVETGEDNITSDRVEKFADALKCSIAYLMGWNEEDDNTIHLPSDIELLIQRYEESDETTRDIIKKILGIKNESC